MNIVLTGYRCCGKSSVGKLIAHRLGMDFVDTDAMIIEKAGCSIDEIVKEKGWPYFREMERDIIKEVSTGDNHVIATGGGVVTSDINMELLKANGIIVWLDADIATVKRRLAGDSASAGNRPSLTGCSPADEISEVMEQRRPLYKKACNIYIDTDKTDINGVADMVIRRVQRFKSIAQRA